MSSKQALAVGIDFGCTSFITLSNGLSFPYPNTLKKMRRDIARVSGRLRSPKSYGSRARLRKRLLDLRENFARIQEAFLDRLITKLITSYHFFFVEDINKERLLRSPGAVASVAKMPWRRFIDKLKGECMSRGKVFVLVPAANTSRMCSNCQLIKTSLKLSERTYLCPSCGHQMDRDINAAHNIARIGKEILNGASKTKTRSRSS